MYFTKIVWLLYDKWTVGGSGRKLGHPLVAIEVVKEQDDDGSLFYDAAGETAKKWTGLGYVLEELVGFAHELIVD